MTRASQHFLAEVKAARVHLVNGRPGAFKVLWSHGDDVTLSGGLGGAIAKGGLQVSERLDWVATQYVGGARVHLEAPDMSGMTSLTFSCARPPGSRVPPTVALSLRSYA